MSDPFTPSACTAMKDLNLAQYVSDPDCEQRQLDKDALTSPLLFVGSGLYEFMKTKLSGAAEED